MATVNIRGQKTLDDMFYGSSELRLRRVLSRYCGIRLSERYASDI